MYRSGDIERWGSGIKRIHDECGFAGIRVDFKRLKTGFAVVFYRPKWEEGDGLDEKGKKSRVKILEMMTVNPLITVQEIAERSGLSIKGIEKAIRLLKKQGRLRRIGPDKGGHWEVTGE